MPSTLIKRRPAARAEVIGLVLRRMRFPLLLILAVVMVCATGFTLIPGSDEHGNPTEPMTYFEAVYVVVFTAATIGFGEVPQAFNSAQRMWMLVTIIVSVGAWSYTLINVLALLQEHGFQNALRTARFSRRIYHLREPFYIVCGIGDTGRLLCHRLDHLGLRFVAIDTEENELETLRMDEFRNDNPMIVADAAEPATLEQVGLLSRHCRGVIAVTGDDATNTAIAVAVRLLAPRIPVLAQIRDDTDAETHIGVFGGDVVVNPFSNFADSLLAAVNTPERYRLRELLIGTPGTPVVHVDPPPDGRWIVYGYGRFGRILADKLREAGMEVVTMDPEREDVDLQGTGDSADLQKLDIDNAAGLACTSYDDVRNLAVAVTARAMKRDIFVIARQNSLSNRSLFTAFDADMMFIPSTIVSQEFIARITTPLLSRFLRLISQLSEADCAELYGKLINVDVGHHPEIWDVSISVAGAPAVVDQLANGHTVTLGDIRTDPSEYPTHMKIIALMIRRDSSSIILPSDDEPLQFGDRILLAGTTESKRRMGVSLQNTNVLHYVQTGVESNGGYLWRWAARLTSGKGNAGDDAQPEPSDEATETSDTDTSSKQN